MKKSLIKILWVILWRKCLRKNRKFVPKESNHKAPDSDLVDKTSDSGKRSIDGEKLDTHFQLESDLLSKKGDSDRNNDGNVEKPVGKSATNKLDERESDDKKEEEKLNQQGQTTKKQIIKKMKKENNH